MDVSLRAAYVAGFMEAQDRFIKLVRGPVKIVQQGEERVLQDTHWLELLVEDWMPGGQDAP